ncbi:unnamed protein product, partial [marine sediment metagenome]
SRMSTEEADRLEEERRLCYVGMTRAMHKLYLTYAEIRRQYGREEYHRPSRFIAELPKECLDTVRLQTPAYSRAPAYQTSSSTSSLQAFTALGDTGYQLGQRVRHAKFGEGVVINYEGGGDNGRVQVNFDSEGTKWLALAYANLEKLSCV